MRKLLFLALLVFITNLTAQVKVEVNLNVNHKLGEVSTFERSKFVTIHADVLSSDWDLGTNSISDTRADFLTGYDVYLGRNTGPINGDLNSAWQDPARPGFVDPDYYTDRRNYWKDYYGSRTSWHQYDNRNNLILCPQLHPFWPDGTNLATSGWAFSQTNTTSEPFGTASGEFLANYVDKVYGTGGTDGQKQPTLIEIVNEPVYELVDWKKTNTLTEVFDFHKTVAQEVKALNPDVKVGGYVTAFPELDQDNFSQWENRWKAFIDKCGDDIDFYSLHLYDMPVYGGKSILRKGGDIEATFDMLEHYSYLKFGAPKTFVISEYGATSHDYQGPWSSYRDWLTIKADNSMMLQFMERANLIEQTINYTMLKVDWWSPNNNGTTDYTWPDRLFRKANEPSSYTGSWVYTDMIYLFELWQNVKGTRVDSWSSDLDVMTDCYVDDNKAYIIVNNLDFIEKTIDLSVFETGGKSLSSLVVKQLYLGESHSTKDQNTVQLDSDTYTSNYPTQLTLKPEGTYILEYTYNSSISINQTSTEVKYYANKYKQAITANVSNSFAIDGVSKGSYGEATLRIGLGRNHNLSLQPTVTVNGTAVTVPSDPRGDAQSDRDTYFGMLEIDVPYDVLQTNNTINVTFADNGGYISSVALQAYTFSTPIGRNGEVVSTPGSINVDDASKYTSTNYVVGGNIDVIIDYNAGTGNTVSDELSGLTVMLREMTADWMTVVNDYVFTNATVVGSQSGTATVTVDLTGVPASDELATGNFYFLLPRFKNTAGEEFAVQGLNPIIVLSQTDIIAVSSVMVNATANVTTGKTYGLSASVIPSNATNQNSDWIPDNEAVATIGADGVVTGVAPGTANIIVTTEDGNKKAVCVVTVADLGLTVDNKNAILTTDHEQGGTLDVIATYNAGIGNTVADDLNGIQVMLRECDANWNVINDYIFSNSDVVGTQMGTVTVSVDLSGVPLTSDLPDGHFYFLLPRMMTNTGTEYAVQDIMNLNIVEGATTQLKLSQADIQLYPNPTNEILYIEGLERVKYSLEIVDMMGLSVMNQTALLTNTINVEPLTVGIYMLILSDGNERKVLRFYKE